MAARSPERVDFLATIIITAVEAGIGYWAGVRNYKWVGSDGTLHGNIRGLLQDASVEVADYEGQDRYDQGVPPWQEVTLDTIARGIGKIERGEVEIAPSLRKTVIAADRDPAEYGGGIDSELADCILQAGLFGEIRYG